MPLRWFSTNRARKPASPGSAVPAAIEAKASLTAQVLTCLAGRAVWSQRDIATLAREGFARNPVVYRAVRLISESAASVPWLIYDGETELADHPMQALLARPNPREAGPAFLESVYGHLLVAGNAYVERVIYGSDPRELYALRPDRIKVVTGADGWPSAFDYTAAGRTVRFASPVGEPSPILHLTLFHPLDDIYGFAPLEAAQVSLDIHNAASHWNKALLDNSARPSGALVYQGKETSNLTDAQFDRLKKELEDGYQGAANAGRPLLLEGGLDWKTMSLSPRDMDFIEAKNAAAREIALAFGVPPMLLGIPGDATYANYVEANRAFWRQTVVPLVARVAAEMSRWLLAPTQSFRPDIDTVPALAEDRDRLWARLEKASFLTGDEKRQAVGYGPKGQA